MSQVHTGGDINVLSEKRQCVFASYHRPNREIDYGRYKYEYDDLVIIKEKFINQDNQVEKKLKMIENFERPILS